MNDHILVKRQDPEKVSAGGIIIPESRQVKSRFGEVLAVGPGRYMENGERQPVAVKPGQVVLFRGTGGTEIDLDGETGHVILTEDDVLAVVE